jgi:hypothetical protein
VRATVHDELSGLDLSEHGEEAYFGGDLGAFAGPGLALGGSVIVSAPQRSAPAAAPLPVEG